MGLLDGMAGAIYAGFKDKLRDGQLRRVVVSESGGTNDQGDPIVTTPVFYPLQGFTDEFSAYERMASGIPQTDLKVCIFGASISTPPRSDDMVEMPMGSGAWYQLRSADTDPAAALWTCRAFKHKAPT